MRSVEEIKKIRESYLPGMRIRLIKMDDSQAPRVGTEGTIRGVDDIGSIMVAWDNGSSLSVIPGEDKVEILDVGEKSKDGKDNEEIYTIYSHEADITFIMEEKNKTTRVVGFYYGEPEKESTKKYYGSLTAEYK